MTVKQRKRQLRSRAFVTALVLLDLIAVLACSYKIWCDFEQLETVIESTVEDEDIIRWKQEDCTEEVTIVPFETEEDKITSSYAGIRFYDVPLSEDLQMHTFYQCDGWSIAPSIILALMERESDCVESAIGDDGNSFGLMQIQPQWWQDVMDKLGCDDLLDPYQNITVGVAIIAQLVEINPDPYWVLMAYNMGPDKATELYNKGIYSDYAIEVLERASELSAEYESR